MSDDIRPPLPPDAIERLLENQSRELAVREKEIELEREKNITEQQTEEHGFEFAKAQLAAMERDRQNDRLYRQTAEKKRLIMIVVFILAVAVFLITSAIKNKDQMIIELVKVVLYGVPCGLGGYTVGRYKKKSDEKTD
jgi:cation transport ATPase